MTLLDLREARTRGEAASARKREIGRVARVGPNHRRRRSAGAGLEEDAHGRTRDEEVGHLRHDGDGGESGIEPPAEGAGGLAVPYEVAEAAEAGGGDVLDLLDGVLGVGLGELPHHEPGKIGIGGEHLGLRQHQGEHPGLGRATRLQAARGALDQLAHEALEHVAVEVFLVGEVVVEQGAVDAGLGADGLDGGAGEAALGEEPLGGIEEPGRGVADRTWRS